MDSITVNAGPLTSYNSLVYYLSPKFKQIRELYLSGITPRITLDLRNLEYGNISISALTGLLCNCKKLRDFLGYAIPTVLKWDPQIQGFLSDIEFFKTAERFKIFQWIPEGIIGGYKLGTINPNTKILFYADIKPFKNIDISEIGIAKASLKQKIAPNFLMRCASLFNDFDDRLEDVIVNTTLELIVNSLMHAEDVAFVGLQRTKNRITISVCDSGIGFSKSLKRTYPQISHFKDLTSVEGIFIGSLIQRNAHGLRLAINEVLNFDELYPSFDFNEGWVIISSFDTELRWQKSNWAKALNYIDSNTFESKKPDILKIFGPPLTNYAEKEKINLGYWKKYENILIGTRITFEIKI